MFGGGLRSDSSEVLARFLGWDTITAKGRMRGNYKKENEKEKDESEAKRVMIDLLGVWWVMKRGKRETVFGIKKIIGSVNSSRWKRWYSLSTGQRGDGRL